MALGAWYEFGQRQLDRLTATATAPAVVSAAQLWSEHFDLAVTVTFDGGVAANVGYSPGDGCAPAPYVYVGPHDRAGLVGEYWNAPFGAFLTHDELDATTDAGELANAFVERGLHLLRSRPDA